LLIEKRVANSLRRAFALHSRAMKLDEIDIRLARDEDRPAIWQMLEPVIRAGETYALPRDMSEADALAYWLAPQHMAWVACVDEVVAGTYYLRANQWGGGGHVANCGYVTAQRFARRGLAEAMCRHSMQAARERGYTAMQFNLVVTSNHSAMRLWTRLGFATVGILPRAFEHPQHGRVDAVVMFREL
jgi:ribosomal protein S18 acetylase RimI-like enzyme